MTTKHCSWINPQKGPERTPVNFTIAPKVVDVSVTWTNCLQNPLIPNFKTFEMQVQINKKENGLPIKLLKTSSDILSLFGPHQVPLCDIKMWYVSNTFH